MRRARVREHASSVLVATLASAFGVALLDVTGYLAAVVDAGPVAGASATVGVVLTAVALVFIVIAVYVGAIVTANTVATIIAGRTRTIALLRLLGSTARAERAAVAREGLLAGVVGAALGALAGTGVAALLVAVATGAGWAPTVAVPYLAPVLALPVGAVVVTTWLASWAGARRVLVVTPLQALAQAEERSRGEALARPGRSIAALVLVIVGAALLALGVIAGLASPAGVLIALPGGVLSFTGVVAGAHVVMPPVLRLVGRVLGSSAPARLAAENAMRHPERSSRMSIGLVIAVTLITMFAVAVSSLEAIMHTAAAVQPHAYDGLDAMLQAVVTVFSVLIGFSALIAAVGLVNTLSLSVLQRTRELGLLRALGFTAAQVRGMIRAESAALTIAAAAAGLVLGIAYGWVGAQSLLGSVVGGSRIVAPAVPWPLVAAVVAGTALLAWVASVTPARRATRVSPVVALAVE